MKYYHNGRRMSTPFEIKNEDYLFYGSESKSPIFVDFGNNMIYNVAVWYVSFPKDN